MKQTVSEAISTGKLDAVSDDVKAVFGVDDVVSDVDYSVSGTMDITTNLPVDETENIVAKALSESLDVHVKDVEVQYDPEIGKVSYSVKNDQFENVDTLKIKLLKRII